MRLGVLGSNKLVTTSGALMCEVFAGENPDETVIFVEDEPQADLSHLSEALSLLGLNTKLRYEVLGQDYARWGEAFKGYDVVDVTPGRKLAALVAASNTIINDFNFHRYIYSVERYGGAEGQ